MRQIPAYANFSTVKAVVKELENVIQNQMLDEIIFDRWYEDKEEFLNSQPNSYQRLNVLGYINFNKDEVFDVVERGLVDIQFSAKMHLTALLEYGSELIIPNDFSNSYDAAFRKLQQTFKSHGYEFSDVIFDWKDDDYVIFLWKNKFPIFFESIVDYPKSLMAFGALLDELSIDGLEFTDAYHFVETSHFIDGMECLEGEAFKKEYILSYGNNNRHLTQSFLDDFRGCITYSLDGRYHLSLHEEIDEKSLISILEGGFHLQGKNLEYGLNGVISVVDVFDY